MDYLLQTVCIDCQRMRAVCALINCPDPHLHFPHDIQLYCILRIGFQHR